jgi:hypothetical protein
MLKRSSGFTNGSTKTSLFFVISLGALHPTLAGSLNIYLFVDQFSN